MSTERLALQSIFRHLPADKLQAIYEAGNVYTIPKGEAIIHQGQPASSLYCILDGEVDVVTLDVDDPHARKLLTTLGPGDSVGEYGFIDRREASATVEAADETQVFELPVSVFDALLQSDPELERIIYKNLLVTLVDRLRTTNVIIDFLRSRDEDPEVDWH